jgi:hypothetical protein
VAFLAYLARGQDLASGERGEVGGVHDPGMFQLGQRGVHFLSRIEGPEVEDLGRVVVACTELARRLSANVPSRSRYVTSFTNRDFIFDSTIDSKCTTVDL